PGEAFPFAPCGCSCAPARVVNRASRLAVRPASAVVAATVVVAVMAPVMGRVRGEGLFVQLVAQDPACPRPVVDVVRGAGADAPVVEEHPGAAVALGPVEELAGEVPAHVVVPGRVLADHEREVLPLR